MAEEIVKPVNLLPENWSTTKRILVILAHPDDPEFFLGGTIARWTALGHEVRYCLLTRGDKGTSDRTMSPQTLSVMREKEQLAAAGILGVSAVRFLDYEDGYLVPDLKIRREVVRVIRQEKPDILVTSDPTNYFSTARNVNHPDHRAAGEIVLSAVFPAAGNPMFFPDLLNEEGLDVHPVEEVWVSLAQQPNVILDVTTTWEKKIRALCEHKSQIGDPQKLVERMQNRKAEDSPPENPRYEERFRRIMMG